MFDSLIVRVQLVVIVVLLVFGGWNWWRKNVYYDALHLVAAQRVQDLRDKEAAGQAALNRLETDLNARSKTREQTLEAQLADAARHPDQRVVYKLRDRWLPVSCPAGTGTGAGAESTGGLQPEDEQFLVRESARADDVADKANTLIDAYNAHRDAVIEWNKKHGR